MTDFKVEPSSKQGGGHPNVTITQSFSYTNGSDSAKDAFVRLQPGLLGNPQAAAFCSQQQFSADACPADSLVGSVEIDATVLVLPVTNQGRVYNLRQTGDEPARIGIVVDAGGGLSKIFLQAPVYVARAGRLRARVHVRGPASGHARSGAPDQEDRPDVQRPGEQGPVHAHADFVRGGHVGEPGELLEAPTTFSQKEVKMTPTGCDSLPFAPTAEGSMGAPGVTDVNEFPPVRTTLRFNPEHAALKRAEVILPLSLQPSLPGAQRACSRDAANASNCPESSRVGTATIDSPLQPAPVKGPIYIAFNTPAALPGLMVILPAPVGVRLDGAVDSGNFGTRNPFPSNPDLPVRSFTLEFDGGRPDALLTLVQDLCAEGTDTTIDAKLIAHNGKQVQFEQELATPGCDPRATVSIRHKGRRATLVARLKAAREGPAITSFSLKLPKALRRGKPRAFVLADGRRMKPRTRRRALSLAFPGDGVRAATVVWRGLRANRKLRRSTRVVVSLKDKRDHTTTLKPRVRVRGKAPKRR